MRVCQFRHIRISSDLYIITIIADYCKRLFANSFLFIIYIWVRHKPGSVSDNHLSWPDVAARLMRPTSRTATGSRFSRPFWSCSGWGLHGQHVSILPVSSYLTISTLPQPYCFGGMFLLHFPYSYLRRTLSGIPALWSPDFPHIPRRYTRLPVLPKN